MENFFDCQTFLLLKTQSVPRNKLRTELSTSRIIQTEKTLIIYTDTWTDTDQVVHGHNNM